MSSSFRHVLRPDENAGAAAIQETADSSSLLRKSLAVRLKYTGSLAQDCLNKRTKLPFALSYGMQE